MTLELTSIGLNAVIIGLWVWLSRRLSRKTTTKWRSHSSRWPKSAQFLRSSLLIFRTCQAEIDLKLKNKLIYFTSVAGPIVTCLLKKMKFKASLSLSDWFSITTLHSRMLKQSCTVDRAMDVLAPSQLSWHVYYSNSTELKAEWTSWRHLCSWDCNASIL